MKQKLDVASDMIPFMLDGMAEGISRYSYSPGFWRGQKGLLEDTKYVILIATEKDEEKMRQLETIGDDWYADRS